MKIYTATKEDLPDILKLGKVLHEESEFRALVFDDEKAKASILAVESDEDSTIIIARDKGLLVGAIGAICTEPFFSRDRVAEDHFVYVHPDYRGKGVFTALFAGFLGWTRTNGASVTYFNHTSGIGDMSVIYTRFGFTQVGKIFRRWF